MNEDELAKLLLVQDFPAEYLWVFESLDSNKYSNTLYQDLSKKAEKKGFSIRVIRPRNIITMDYDMRRINLNLDEQDNIIKIDIG